MDQLNGHQHTDEEKTLTAKQARLIELLVGGSTIVAAATQLQVNESSCRRWLKLPHVDKAYQAAKDDLFHQVLVGLQKRSLTTLQKHITAPVEPTPSSQIRAIALVFEQVMLIEKVNEIEKKFAELEAVLRREDGVFM